MQSIRIHILLVVRANMPSLIMESLEKTHSTFTALGQGSDNDFPLENKSSLHREDSRSILQ